MRTVEINIQVEVFWMGFRGPNRTNLRNGCILPHHYTASQSRRPRLESSVLWKPHISKSVLYHNEERINVYMIMSN